VELSLVENSPVTLPPEPQCKQSPTAHLTSPIIPLLTRNALSLASYLQSKHFLARPIRHPTVPLGEERVRVCVHAGNTQAHVDGLLEAILQWAKKESSRTTEGLTGGVPIVGSRL
jgi:8-amino-7-oxononanoate synthase